jgi:hypothetical protein
MRTFDRRHRRVLASAGHLGGDRTQLGHDLAIMGAVSASASWIGRRGATEGPFDAKALATRGHETLPSLHFLSF